jgi:hypothetical protein
MRKTETEDNYCIFIQRPSDCSEACHGKEKRNTHTRVVLNNPHLSIDLNYLDRTRRMEHSGISQSKMAKRIPARTLIVAGPGNRPEWFRWAIFTIPIDTPIFPPIRGRPRQGSNDRPFDSPGQLRYPRGDGSTIPLDHWGLLK